MKSVTTMILPTPLLLGLLVLAFPTFAEKPRATLDCREMVELESLFEPGIVILFGELHGTQEAPAFIADAACLVAKAGHRVRVGLEMNQEEMERIESFMGSKGTDADRSRLLEGSFWHPKAQDGRSSAAMLDLLDALRKLRRGGHSVSLTLFDSVEFHQPNKDRDALMAARLSDEIGPDLETITLVLTGNIHSRVAQGTPWDEDFQPMGLYMSKGLSKHRLVALDLSWSGGSAWMCKGPEPEDCGAAELRLKREGKDRQLKVENPKEPGANKHHGWYHLGRLSPSPPAIDGAGS